MSQLSNAIEVCITRHECERSCMNCRYKGNACINMHRKLAEEHRELARIKRTKGETNNE